MRASRPWSEGSSNVPCLSIGRSITLVNRDIRGLIWAAVMGVRNRPAKRRDLPSVECPNASPARFRASAFLCPRTKRMAGAGMLGLEAGRTGHRGLGFDWDRPPHDQATYILAVAQLRLKSLQLPAGGMAFSPMPHIRRARSRRRKILLAGDQVATPSLDRIMPPSSPTAWRCLAGVSDGTASPG